MTLDEALERIADLESQIAFMHREFDNTMAAMAMAGQYAGVDLGTTVSEPAQPMGQLLDLPVGRVPRKRVAGGAAHRAIPSAAPRRASTPVRAS